MKDAWKKIYCDGLTEESREALRMAIQEENENRPKLTWTVIIVRLDPIELKKQFCLEMGQAFGKIKEALGYYGFKHVENDRFSCSSYIPTEDLQKIIMVLADKYDWFVKNTVGIIAHYETDAFLVK